MKTDIHPDYETTTIICACGRETETRGTMDEYHVEICSHCHPFFTGKQKLVDTEGRVERFLSKYGDEEAEERAEEAAARAEESEKVDFEQEEAEEAEEEGEAPPAEPEASGEEGQQEAAGETEDRPAEQPSAGQ